MGRNEMAVTKMANKSDHARKFISCPPPPPPPLSPTLLVILMILMHGCPWDNPWGSPRTGVRQYFQLHSQLPNKSQFGPVVRALALISGDPGFKNRSDHSLNLILVVPGSTSQLHL